jgi:hypothetical protein
LPILARRKAATIEIAGSDGWKAQKRKNELIPSDLGVLMSPVCFCDL